MTRRILEFIDTKKGIGISYDLDYLERLDNIGAVVGNDPLFPINFPLGLDLRTFSKVHATIHLKPREPYLSDTGSINGTFVITKDNPNKKRLDRGLFLRNGDQIYFGEFGPVIYKEIEGGGEWQLL